MMTKARQIHVSQIDAYRCCPRMYYYAHIQRLVPVVESSKLTFGSGIHKGLETYYRTYDRDLSMNVYSTWLNERVEVLVQKGADMKDFADMIALGPSLLDEYITFAKNNDDFVTAKFNGEPAVEQRFRVPLWGVEDCVNDGTFDGVVRDKYGRLWIMEHKTAQSFPSDLDLRLNWQATVYILAAQQLFQDGVQGIVYNVIRKTNPKRARTPVIDRRFVTRNPHELKTSMEQIARKVNQMLSDTVFDPNPGQWCNWRCAYQQICLCLQDGTDPGLFIKNNYTIKEVEDDGTDTYRYTDEG